MWSLISRNSGGSKVSRHAYASRDSPPSHTLLDQKLDPCVQAEPFSKTTKFNKNMKSLMHYLMWAVLRGGPNFGPVKYVKEVSHVKHMHANSDLLVHFNFSSKLMVTWLKPNFGPLSKTQFWHAYASRDWPPSHTLLDQNLDPRVQWDWSANGSKIMYNWLAMTTSTLL